jgi:hypothetical protein
VAASLVRKLPPSRIIICGGPRSGKTTLAFALSDAYRVKVNGTDELRGLEWSDSSLVASTWFDRPGPWIVEGVVTPRALRKWLASRPYGAPADYILWMNKPVSERVRGQESMAKGCATVWDEVEQAVRDRGTRVLYP